MVVKSGSGAAPPRWRVSAATAEAARAAGRGGATAWGGAEAGGSPRLSTPRAGAGADATMTAGAGACGGRRPPRRRRRRSTSVHDEASASREASGGARAAGAAGCTGGGGKGDLRSAGAGGRRRRVPAQEAKEGSGPPTRRGWAGATGTAGAPVEAAPRGVPAATTPLTTGRVARGATAGGRAGTETASSIPDGATGPTERAPERGARGDEEGGVADAGKEDDDDEDRPAAGEPERSSDSQPVNAARPLARTTSTADSNSKHGSSTGNPAINALTARMTAPAKADAASPPPIADDIAPPKPGGG